MRNFYFNEGEGEYHDGYEDMEESESIEFFIPVAAEIQMAHLDLASVDLNQKLLSEAIKILEKSWLWRFTPLDVKLQMIEKTYIGLTTLMENAVSEEEDDEE